MVEQEQHVEFAVLWIGDVLVASRGDARSFAHVHETFTAIEDLAAHFGEEFIDARTVGAERERAGVAFLTDWIIGDFGAFLTG